MIVPEYYISVRHGPFTIMSTYLYLKKAQTFVRFYRLLLFAVLKSGDQKEERMGSESPRIFKH